MKPLAAAVCVLTMSGLIGAVAAAEKQNPVGTWDSSATVGGQKRESKLKFKLEGEKLTGTLTTQEGTEVKVQEGKFKDDKVTFNITFERDGQSFTIKFNGKVDGNYGAELRTAIEGYEKAEGLQVTGLATVATLKRLGGGVAAEPKPVRERERKPAARRAKS